CPSRTRGLRRAAAPGWPSVGPRGCRRTAGWSAWRPRCLRSGRTARRSVSALPRACSCEGYADRRGTTHAAGTGDPFCRHYPGVDVPEPPASLAAVGASIHTEGPAQARRTREHSQTPPRRIGCRADANDRRLLTSLPAAHSSCGHHDPATHQMILEATHRLIDGSASAGVHWREREVLVRTVIRLGSIEDARALWQAFVHEPERFRDTVPALMAHADEVMAT